MCPSSSTTRFSKVWITNNCSVSRRVERFSEYNTAKTHFYSNIHDRKPLLHPAQLFYFLIAEVFLHWIYHWEKSYNKGWCGGRSPKWDSQNCFRQCFRKTTITESTWKIILIKFEPAYNNLISQLNLPMIIYILTLFTKY